MSTGVTLGSVRALSGPESEAFRLARLVACERTPYFATALFAVAPLAYEGLGTFGVDARWRLYMDPACLVGQGCWSIEDAAGVLLHEVGHLIRDHAGRVLNLPAPTDRLAWNLAGDCEINDDLLAAGIALPGEPATPQAFALIEGRFAEWYYEALRSQPDGGSGLPDDGGLGCGGGAGSAPLPGELPADAGLGDCGEPVDPAAAALLRRRVARDILDHSGHKGIGTAPAGLSRWASSVLAPPSIPWSRILRAVVRRAIADRAGRVNYTYSRPSRRSMPGIIRPAMRAPLVTVSVVVDTSGSMSQGDLDAAMSEVKGVLRASGVRRDGIALVSCDAAATTVKRVRGLASVELAGGGGTDMRVGIAAAEAARPSPDLVVVLTDGYTPWPSAPTSARLVCGIINSHEAPPTPSWATTVRITPTSGTGAV